MSTHITHSTFRVAPTDQSSDLLATKLTQLIQ
jgi:hypothetical protein